MSLKKKAAIIGIGEIKPSKSPEEKTALGLITEVSKIAIEDAGLKKQDIDGLLTGASMSDFCLVWPSAICEYMQIFPQYADVVDLGGASPAGMVWRAAAAISAGLCETVLCITGDAWDISKMYGAPIPFASIETEFENPYGPMAANSGYALIAQRHMYEYGTTPTQLAKIAVDQRTNACANPAALFYGKPITIEDVLGSPLVVDPLHMLEIVMPCTGAAALVVTSPERAKDAPYTPVYLLGAGEYCTHLTITNAPSLTTSPVKVAAGKAFEMAGLTPQDIDLVFPYDCYTIMVLITLEDAGFCEKGEGGRFVEETDLTYKGQLPMNTHGGQLSFGQPGLAGGMSHIIEAVRQLRGLAQGRQVANAETAFVNGNGGIMSEECSIILGR
jgi:acetyl-CoA acetyltransferase